MQHIEKLSTRELQELHYQQLVANVGNTSSLSQVLIAVFCVGMVILLISVL